MKLRHHNLQAVHRYLINACMAALVLAIALLPLAPLSGQTGPPQLVLTPASAQAGATVTASGSGFPVSATGQLLWPDGSALAAFAADANGLFVLDFVVPAVAPGPYAISAVTDDGTVRVEATLTVESISEPTAIPPTAPPPTELPLPTLEPAAPPTYPILASGHSDNSPDASVVYDGDPATYWLTGVIVPTDAWLTLDLGQVLPISSLRWLMATQGTLPVFDIELSEDGVTWASLVTLDGATLPVNVWIEQPVDIWARYVRIAVPNEEGLAQVGGIAEIEVWPAPAARPISAIITPEPLPTESLEPTLTPELVPTEAIESTVAPEQPASAGVGTGIISGSGGSGVNCRVAPDVSAPVIATLPEGTQIEMTGPAAGDWQPVTCAGQPGYVAVQFVTVDVVAAAGSPSPEPTVATAPETQPLATPTADTPAAATPEVEARIAASVSGDSLSLPLRAAFYYPWYPGAWTQRGTYPYTIYHPTRGFYDGGDPSVIAGHIADMQYGGIDVGIASWWGQGSREDARMPQLLSAASGTGFKWTIYYEDEGFGNPTSDQLRADLEYVRDSYASDPSYLRIDGRFVVFVYGSGETCGMVNRWLDANATVNAYLVLKVFNGYRSCANQPDDWHQYGPADNVDAQADHSYSISPGFHLYGQAQQLPRDLARWEEDVRGMIASGADWQLVTTFNEWGEGTAIESADEWQSASGRGLYLDVLHNDGQAPPPVTPTSVPPTVVPDTTIPPIETPTETAASPGETTFTAVADTQVSAGQPDTNYGEATRLQSDLSPNREIYLRFDAAGLRGTVQSATVRVWVVNGTSNGPSIYVSDGMPWDEALITWLTKPLSLDLVDDAPLVPAGRWLEYDVTSAISGDGTYTFVLIPQSTDGLYINSREAPSNPPQLVVETTEGGTTPTSVALTPTPESPTATVVAPTPTSVPPTPTTTPRAPTPTPTPTPRPTTVPPAPTAVPSGDGAILLAAGDVSTCSNDGDEQTARILDREPGTIAALGDLAYESGTAQQFRDCYDPTWGRHKDRTMPAPGNHEYNTDNAAGYFDYFGPRAGDPSGGYYSYDLGSWHIIALNSNISMSAGSAQEQWLRRDLAANPATCTLAYWHHPRFSSSSTHGNTPSTGPLYQALYEFGAEIVLTGHDHTYERFAPQDPNARADPDYGIREWVVGTGGRSHYGLGTVQPNSEVRNANTLGVLKLTLGARGYSWQFLPVAGASFTDSGSGTCHVAPGSATTAEAPVQTERPSANHVPVALPGGEARRQATSRSRFAHRGQATISPARSLTPRPAGPNTCVRWTLVRRHLYPEQQGHRYLAAIMSPLRC